MAARMKITPTSRTLDYLRARGYVAGETERHQGRIKRDLFGCIDIHAVHERGEFLYVQVTDDTHRAHRVAKTTAKAEVRTLLKAGARVEIWTWSHDRALPHITRLRVRPTLKDPALGGATE